MDISVGDRFTRLIVIADEGSLGKSNGWHRRSLCRCDCGTEKIIANTHLIQGYTQSCGCLWLEAIKKANTGPRKDDRSIALKRLYSNKRKNAKYRKIDFNLTKLEFDKLSQQNCFYCGTTPSNQFNEYKATRPKPFAYSGIDRADNTKGYTSENSVPCCKTCNLAKRDLTIEEFRQWIENVYNKTILSSYRED